MQASAHMKCRQGFIIKIEMCCVLKILSFNDQGWKNKVFWCMKVCAPQSKFRRTLCASKLCSPCDFSSYTCSPHRVPRCAPNEVSYGKMNQYNKILQFPHVKARRLSKKKKPRLCFTR